MTIPLSNLYDEFLNLFDKPEKAITSESKATDIKEDELKKIIDDDAKNLENKPPILKDSNIPSQPQAASASLQG